MSIYGSQVLSDIENASRQARAKAQAEDRRLSEIQSRHAAATTQLRQAYEKLTQVRTLDTKASHKALASIDAWLTEAASKRETDYRHLMTQITQANALAEQFNQALAQHTSDARYAQQAWDSARLSMRDSLSRTDAAFSAALQRQSDAVRRNRAVDQHLTEISQNTKTFTKSCESDPLFVYCARRRVGSVDSLGNPLTRRLDKLVARACNYYRHRELLNNANDDLDQWVRHQSLMHGELVDANAQVERALDDALSSPAGEALSRALDMATKQLVKTTRERTQAHAGAALLASQKTAYDEERDPQSQHMRERVFEAVSQASDQVLMRAAAETQSGEDDEAAGRVASLRREIPEMSGQITQAAEDARSSSEQASRLESLVSNFRSQGFNGSYSRFDYGFDSNTLITGVLLGRMSVNQAITQCNHSHRDVTPPPPPPSSPGYGSDTGTSGGFSSGGGVSGGGGFSTGGGF